MTAPTPAAPAAARPGPRPCESVGEHTGPVRPYASGWLCSRHSPWGRAGRPEPQPGPGWPSDAWSTPSPQSSSRVHDARAVATGKRRSTPATYRAAQAAVRKDKTA